MALSRRTGQRFQASIWPGFVDAMTGLLMVIMFLLTIFMVLQYALSETIEVQDSELDSLASEVSALAAALGLEERQTNQLQARMGALNTTLNDTQSDLDLARAEMVNQASIIATLTIERDRQDAQLDAAENRITGFESQVAALLADRSRALDDIATLEGQRSDLQAAQAELLSEQEALNLALARTRTEIDAQTEVARLAAARREALEALIDDLRSQGSASAAEAEQLAGKVSTLEQQLSEEEIARLAEAATARALIDKLRAQGSASAAEAEQLAGKVITLEQQLSEGEIARLVEAAAAKALRDKLAGADAELTAMTLALEAQRQDAEDTLTLLAAADAARDELDKRLAELLTQIDIAQAQLNDRDELAERLTRVLAQMEVTQSASAQTMVALEAELARIRTESDQVRASLTAELSAAQNDVAQTRETLQASLAQTRADAADAQDVLRAELAAAQVASSQAQAALQAALARQRAQTVQTQSQYADELARLQVENAAIRRALEEQLAQVQSDAQATQTALNTQLAAVRAEATQAQADLEAQLARVTAEGAGVKAALSDELSKVRVDAANRIAALEAELGRMRADLAIARSSAANTVEDRASVEARLLKALESLERAQASAASDQEVLRARLAAALAARQSAESNVSQQMTLAEQRAVLLAKARETLSEQKSISEEAHRQTALLNQQVAALRTQLGGLQALLDDFKERDVAANVQLQNLGSDLNAALARAASEERKRRLLEEAERKRLEIEVAESAAEAENFRAQAKDLERFRSEFFGRLRDVLGSQEGVRIEGDRFVFASEVLFPPGGADLSFEGQLEIAKVANILRSVAGDIPPEIDWVIRVDGHTDNTPLGGHPRFRDNWELSQGRALSVVRYMVEKLAIPPDRLSANGFGEFQPVNRADTPEARAQNRRIELKFTEK